MGDPRAPCQGSPFRKRLPALDGLRGVAVLLVLAGHSRAAALGTAGTAGVTVFFVLSGYLITGLLLDERERVGRIALKAFYLRRCARLLPALLVMLAVTAPALILTGHGQSFGNFDLTSSAVLTGAFAALLYVGNFLAAWRIDSPFTHAWSLSLEEQFYIAWPVTLVALGVARRAWRVVAALAGMSIVARLVVWHLGYWGPAMYLPLTAAGPLLLGCVVAMHPIRRAPVLLGLVLLVVASLGPRADPLFEAGQILAVVPASVAAVALLASRPVWLEDRVLGWIGRRSYGIYLWHYPLLFLPPFTSFAWPARGLAASTAAILVAAASWRWIEEPVLRRSGRRTYGVPPRGQSAYGSPGLLPAAD